MNAEELEQNESDDSSDEDYNPAGVVEAGSEEDSAGEDVSGGEGDSGPEDGKKRKKPPHRRPRKKIRNGKVKEVEEKEEEKENSKIEELTEEETKLKSDKLWADFLKDCDPPTKKSQPSKPELTEPEAPKVVPKAEPQSKLEPKETTVLTFAGEEVKVERPAAGRRSGGLGSLLSKIGKAGKLSTLEKSKLDWEHFKDKEGIKEDLESFNKGKSGYLERQDFLTRTDVRQFELEKQMRSQRRSLNR